MKKKIDLSTLSIEELTGLSKDIEKAIQKKSVENLKEARAAAEAAAKKYGLTLNEVLKPASGGKPVSKKLPPKYRHPENPEITWSGKGRQPGWYRDAITAGTKAEDLAI